MRKKTYQGKTVVFILIAVCFMILIDRVLLVDRTPAPVVPEVATAQDFANEEEGGLMTPSNSVLPDFAPALTLSTEAALLPPEETVVEQPAAVENTRTAQPQWRRNAVESSVPKGKPRVVIIIDDMGMDRVHTREATALPGPVTFAFLPYAGDLKAQTEVARKGGHELIVHVPMEPMNGHLNAGPSVLKVDSTPEEFLKTLNDDLGAFDGYVGINNHMGSRMTQDRAGMQRVMAVLKQRGLLFVDSKTIAHSVAEDEARNAGIPYAGRDVFLDHDENYEAVTRALAQTEREALKNGLAIAIGHPKPATIRALREWLPTLEAKGIYLVPVSASVTVPE